MLAPSRIDQHDFRLGRLKAYGQAGRRAAPAGQWSIVGFDFRDFCNLER
jgi:hypothetical protein